MQLEPGASLAHYEIIAPLGKGGMGEVFRAKDTKLGREVAIKVLPADFTADAERLARFDREARMLASLNHPHVASIHGFEDAGGLKFLVMELAEGMTLADRMRSGPIPVEEAISIARQIVDALESAHDKGIIHRDLKPANVVVDEEGKVKVLDFGLAKAMDVDESSSSGADITNSPTMIRAATNAGVILGTAAYMSPEQAKGKKVDRRADVWSLGVVLFEMLTGEKLFDGETVSETLAAVIMKDVDLDRLPGTTPPHIRKLIQRCLTKDPKIRLQAIGEARILLSEDVSIGEAGDRSPDVAPAPSRRPSREIAAWALVAVLLVALATMLMRTRSAQPTVETPMTISLDVFKSEILAPDGGSSVVISPDGTRIVYVARDLDGAAHIYLQKIDQLGVAPIPGTEGGASPFFSPDGQWVAFFSDQKLKKVSLSGGAPLNLCDANLPRGGSWGEGGLIVFSGGLSTGLSTVSEDGGVPEELTTLDASRSERSHRWPQFLPGGKGVLFMAQKAGQHYENSLIKVVDVESKQTKTLHSGGSYPRYSRSGHLLFARSGILFALAMDPATFATTGTPKPVLQELYSRTANEATDDGTAHYDISSNGTLVYRRGIVGSNLSRIAIVGRQNNRIATSKANNYLSPRISPDATKVAVVIAEESGSDIWVWDISRDTLSRLTFEQSNDSWPVWSPDGRRIAYTSTTRDSNDMPGTRLLVKAADGSGSAVPIDVEGPQNQFAGTTSWSRDGGTILVMRLDDDGGIVDIDAISLQGAEAGKTRNVISGPAVELMGDLSPDGRWIAYQSNESGTPQVYVRRFDGSEGKWQISSDGGTEPSWTREGNEIVWRNADEGFLAAAITPVGESLSVGQAESITIDGRYVALDPLRLWDVSDDGETFVLLESDEESGIDEKSVVLVTNWFDELKRLAPTE